MKQLGEALTAMNKAQRNSFLILAPLMRIVHVQRPKPLDLNVARELRYFVDSSLAGAPVESILPAVEESPDVRHRDTV